MTTKWRYIAVLITVLTGFYFCRAEKQTKRQKGEIYENSCDSIRQQALIDIHGQPIIYLLDENKAVYYREDGFKIIVHYNRGVEFIGGKDSLSVYLLTKYINHLSYNHLEYNVHENFFILFDKNLDIKEVRIMYRNNANNERFYYDNIFIDALKNTVGMWNKIVEDAEWYVYLHRQRIY